MKRCDDRISMSVFTWSDFWTESTDVQKVMVYFPCKFQWKRGCFHTCAHVHISYPWVKLKHVLYVHCYFLLDHQNQVSLAVTSSMCTCAHTKLGKTQCHFRCTLRAYFSPIFWKKWTKCLLDIFPLICAHVHKERKNVSNINVLLEHFFTLRYSPTTTKEKMDARYVVHMCTSITWNLRSLTMYLVSIFFELV